MRRILLSLLLLCTVFTLSLESQAASCRQMYHDDAYDKAKDEVLSRGLKLGLSAAGVVVSILTTALTLGMAAPATIPLFVISAGVGGGEIAYNGYKIAGPLNQADNDKVINFLLTEADSAIKGKASEGFLHFVTGLSGNAEAKSVARILIGLDQHAQICDVFTLNGERNFRFLEKEEVFAQVRTNLLLR